MLFHSDIYILSLKMGDSACVINDLVLFSEMNKKILLSCFNLVPKSEDSMGS